MKAYDVPAATLKLFLPHGDPKRIRIAELSNWTGKAVAGPRSDFDEVLSREESLKTGVYFLTGTDPESNRPAVYVGEAECIRDRIRSHTAKDFWNNVVFFISKDDNLTKAHIRYLEGRLLEIAASVGRYVVMNSQQSGARLPESDREDMEVFLEKMQQVLPVLGVEAMVHAISMEDRTMQQKKLYCQIKDVSAEGYRSPGGLVVLAGSEAVLEVRPSAAKYPYVLTFRNGLIESGDMIEENGKYRFTKDVEFTSPSAAASVIHGGSANGLTSWRDGNGKSLKDIEQAE